MEKASALGRFVGRQTELAAIDQAISAARDGRPQIVLISGEAGVGKSRLMHEFNTHAIRAGVLVLVGGCVSSREGAAPLAPFAEALRGLERQVGSPALAELAGPARAALAGLLPGLSGARGEEERGESMHATSQVRLHAHLLDFLLRLAERQPLALVIEDIHWADRETLELLRLFARNIGDSRVLLVATYRVDEEDVERRLPSFVAELQRAGEPMRIAMHPFTRAELAEHAHAVRGEPLDQAVLNKVYARSEGNPFYAEQLLAAQPAADMLPANLQELLEARIGALTPGGRSIVCALAVHATPVTEAHLRAVTRLPPDDFSLALRELIDRKLVERQLAGGDDALALRHALLQEAAYAELFPSERLAMHAAFAGILEELCDQDADDPFLMAELARHWEAAGEIRSAFMAALRAAQSAEAAYSPALAAEQYERALRLRRRLSAVAGVDGNDELELLERAALAAAGIGSSRSIELIESALELVDADKDPIKAGLLSERLGRYRWHAADGAGALDAYEEAVTLVPAQPPTSARARVAAGLAQVLMIQHRISESVPWCDEAVEIARAVGDRAIEAHATNTMGMNTAYLGDPERGLAMLQTSKDIAEEIGSVDDVGRALVNIVDVLRVWGRLDEAARFGREAFRFQTEHGLTTMYGVAGLVDAAWSLHWLGRWTEARGLIDEARRHPGDVNDQIMCLSIGAAVEACQGEVALAESHLEMAGPLLANVIDTQLLIPHAEAAAEAALLTGKPNLAVRVVNDAIARAQQPVGANVSRFGPVYWLGIRAAADAVLALSVPDDDDRLRAREVAQHCSDEMSRLRADIASQAPVFGPLAEAYWALCRAEWLRFDGENEPTAWDDAAVKVSGFGLQYVYSYCRWREGVALLRASGHARDARRALIDAHLVASEIGAHPLRRNIEAVAGRAQIRLFDASPPDPPSGDRQTLTAREVEVLRLLSTGRTNRQIGEELFITEKTASVHVSNIMSKLGASRRGEAVAMAAELGLAGPRPGAGA